MTRSTTVSVMGASGYIGGEVLRLLSTRDDIEIVQATSGSRTGKYVHDSHPNLRGYGKLKFTSPDHLEDADVIFSALPHGMTHSRIGEIMDHSEHVIDMSADMRLKDPDTYLKYYGEEHSAPELLSSFPYGIPELHRDRIRDQGRAAAPGCVASSLILGLYPFRDIAGKVIADIKIGSSASGSRHSASGHHPERSGTIRPYAPAGHRHEAEVKQETGTDVIMTVHAVEMVRGIFSTIHIDLREGIDQKEVWRRLRDSYSNETFVRIVKGSRGLFRYPDPKLLSGTNFCDLGFELDRKNERLIVFSALDNLVKGGAGAAAQSMNVILGIEETRGLEFPGLHPV